MKWLLFVVIAVLVGSHLGLVLETVLHLLASILRAAVVLVGSVGAGIMICVILSAVGRWLTAPVPSRPGVVAPPTPPTPARSAPSETATPPPVTAAPRAAERRRFQITIVPYHPSADRPEESDDGQGRLIVLSSASGTLSLRVDPVTRTGFACGEHAVQCGGCGRLYKVDTCRALEYACPVDHASLHLRRTLAART